MDVSVIKEILRSYSGSFGKAISTYILDVFWLQGCPLAPNVNAFFPRRVQARLLNGCKAADMRPGSNVPEKGPIRKMALSGKEQEQ